ncbi:hypothetical protein BDD12DRAFT_801968 [Trichophaea hybrida]|nr:hypothetical protein BDD12DRAFT_801968 [Trichophaea hybrida]
MPPSSTATAKNNTTKDSQRKHNLMVSCAMKPPITDTQKPPENGSLRNILPRRRRLAPSYSVPKSSAVCEVLKSPTTRVVSAPSNSTSSPTGFHMEAINWSFIWSGIIVTSKVAKSMVTVITTPFKSFASNLMVENVTDFRVAQTERTQRSY